MDYRELNFPLDTDHLLALSLSAPLPTKIQSPIFTVQFVDDGVDCSIRSKPKGSDRIAKVLASKETIAFAILLNRIYCDIQHKDVSSNEMFHRPAHAILHEALSEVAKEHISTIRKNKDMYLCVPNNMERKEIYGYDLNAAKLLRHFDYTTDVLKEIDERTHKVLASLEDAGLVRDPWTTGTAGLMVLVGLVPVRWSVRTPKGQDIYREIKIRAGLWTLDIKKRRKGKKKWSDWDFNLKGFRTVRKLLKGFLEEFIDDDGDDIDPDLD